MSVRHPSESRLALFAGGDCGAWTRFTMQRHLRQCTECEEKVTEFRDIRQVMRETAMRETDGELVALNWDRLSAEIHANIRLGLAAGECVREVPALRKRKWNPALALACASVALVIGASALMMENIRLRSAGVPAAAHTASAMPVLQSTGQGIEVRTGSGSLMLLPHDGATPDETLHRQGAIQARYTDGEAGTVTVNTVYE